MAKPAKRSPERKLQVVLSVLRGEASDHRSSTSLMREGCPMTSRRYQTDYN